MDSLPSDKKERVRLECEQLRSKFDATTKSINDALATLQQIPQNKKGMTDANDALERVKEDRKLAAEALATIL